METAALSERVRFGAFEFDTCTRELYKQHDIPVWEDASVLESFEDDQTGDIVIPEAVN